MKVKDLGSGQVESRISQFNHVSCQFRDSPHTTHHTPRGVIDRRYSYSVVKIPDAQTSVRQSMVLLEFLIIGRMYLFHDNDFLFYFAHEI